MLAMARREMKGAAMAKDAIVAARLEKWAGVVEEWKGSGLSQKEYCRSKGIAFSTYGYWQKRLRETGWKKKSESAEAAGFKLVHVVENKSSSSGLEIILCSGVKIAVKEKFDPGVLRAVVAALSQ